MSKSKGAVIENATAVIECFGGIRPMAKKMDVAVTTVQGWKKRDVIPAARREQVFQAAVAHDIDLSGILDGVLDSNPTKVAPSNSNKIQVEEPSKPDVEEVPSVPESSNDEPVSEKEPEAVVHSDEQEKDVEVSQNVRAEKPQISIEDRLADTERRAVTKSTWISGLLVLLGLGAVIALLWPQEKQVVPPLQEQRIKALEEKVDTVNERQSFFGTLIPENLGAQLEDLKTKTEEMSMAAGQVVAKAHEVSKDVLAEDAGTFDQRVEKLGVHVSDVISSPALESFLGNIGALGNSAAGQVQLDQIMEEMSALMDAQIPSQDGVEGEVASPVTTHQNIFESMLLSARDENPVLGQAFGGVPQEDLKAAAMLLTMSQFRSALNRDNEAFESDLKVLQGLVGEEDQSLKDALSRLAPHAKDGVLTPSGLSNEFKTLAGDAVVASLSGEDVSFQERAKARMNEVFQVEKNGELVTGTETQNTLAKVETLLDQGDLETAISTAQGLDGDAAKVMAPWLDEAKITLMVQKVQKMLGQNVNIQALGAKAGAAGRKITASGMGGGGKLLRDEETGINVLIPGARDDNGLLPKKPKAPADANPFR